MPRVSKTSVPTSAPIVVEGIEAQIIFVRGQKVMLASDLASLYEIQTGALMQAVKRNITRFPGDFMFQLNIQEVKHLKSQFVISSWGGSRYLPYVFTEQGVAMLSSVLRSDRAVAVNIEIMRVFVRLRNLLETNRELAKKLEILEEKYDEQFRVVFDAIRALMAPPQPKKKRPIGFVVSED